MVAVTTALPLLTAVKGEILPVPEVGRPMDGVLLVQLNVVPGTVPVNVTIVVLEPSQTVWPVTAATVGVGLTVMVKVMVGPVQVTPALVYLGETLMVATTGAVPVLTALNGGMFPVPEADNPIEVVLLVQLNTVPVTAPLKLMLEVVVALHTT